MVHSKKFLSILVVSVLALLTLGAKWFLFDRNTIGLGAVRIESLPRSTVFINEKEVGQTPLLKEKMLVGEYNIKLVPKTQFGEELSPWQTKIKIIDGTLTYISRGIAPSEDQSSGQILMLARLSSEQSAELAVVASPDDANISMDGLDRGKAPLVLRDLTVGDHQVVVSKEGFSDQIMQARMIAGYRLNAIVKLGALSSNQLATISGQLRPATDLIATISSQTLTRPYVIIKDTPTGFLRVRVEAAATASEVGQVKPGEKYPFLSETDGWVKIKLPTIFGWVSDQYVEKVK